MVLSACNLDTYLYHQIGYIWWMLFIFISECRFVYGIQSALRPPHCESPRCRSYRFNDRVCEQKKIGPFVPVA